MIHSISSQDLEHYRKQYTSDPVSKVAASAVSKSEIDKICFDKSRVSAVGQKFSLDLPTLEATDQKESGRCWIFAGLNILREKAAKKLQLESFELSANYIAFYDHLEKANTFLEHILETAADPLDDRYVSMLFSAPVGDGGWWEYFVGICRKYGAVPKEAMPETYQSTHTEQMNTIVNMQLRKDGMVLRRAVEQGKSSEDTRAIKQEMLGRIYRFLCICLGTPPQTFDFEYIDKNRIYHALRDLSPKDFYARCVGEDLDNVVSILNAPIDLVPYHRTCYTAGEESIYGIYQAKRLNLPPDEFKAAVLRQLQAGELVWFVCDCDYYGSREEGIWDTRLYDYESLFGLDLQMSKGDLLCSRQCSLNHAMVITGVNLVDGKPDKWKIQNSWGAEHGEKGYFVISDPWFDRYVFTASIHRKYLTEQQRRDFDRESMILSPWNVLG